MLDPQWLRHVLLSMLLLEYLGLKTWLQVWLVSIPSLLLASSKAFDTTHGCDTSHGPSAHFGSIHTIPEGSGRAAVPVSMASLHLSISSFLASLLAAATQTTCVGHISEKAFVGFSSSCQHSHRQHLGDLFPSVPHLFLFTAVIGWKHMKKGWTCGKIPPLLTEGYIYTPWYPWTLPRCWMEKCQLVGDRMAGSC